VLKTHGMRNTPEYGVWLGMKSRCYDPGCNNYKRYGARGISVCKEWRSSFTAFLDHVGKRPSSEHSLDRIDNSGNYQPGNVRWATRMEQRRNSRQNHYVIVNGGRMVISDACKMFGFPLNTILSRVTNGEMGLADALMCPMLSRKKKSAWVK
jgi:hypothetical protein